MAERNIVLRNSSIYDNYRFDLLTNLLSLKPRSEVKYDIFKSLFGNFCMLTILSWCFYLTNRPGYKYIDITVHAFKKSHE